MNSMSIQRIGLVLFVAAAVSYSARMLWSKSRAWCPVDIPVSLAKGSHIQTGQFRLNVTGPYTVEIAAHAGDKLSPNELSCLLGVGVVWPARTCSAPAVLKLSWLLSSDKAVVAKGSSVETPGEGGSGPEIVTRTLGRFEGEKGKLYDMDVRIEANGSSLAGASPRLRFKVADTMYEYNLVVDGFFKVSCLLTAVVGTVFFLIGAVRGHRLPGPSI